MSADHPLEAESADQSTVGSTVVTSAGLGGGADGGFHAGELAVQRRAGVEAKAARFAGMLEPAQLDFGFAAFLAQRTFGALTGRDRAGRLWISPLTGAPGFIRAASPSTVVASAGIAPGDPLQALEPDQRVAIVVIEFATRDRIRINGLLTESDPQRLVISVEQAYGNCPKYIQQRDLTGARATHGQLDSLRHGQTLLDEDRALIRDADTLFLGTTNPERGSDASHRGGPPGFVRVEGDRLWWPDYAGNNLFNSFGNLAVDPEAALLLPDFTTGKFLQLTGTASVEWLDPGAPGDDGRTGRRVWFTPQELLAGHSPALIAHESRPYPGNPKLTDN